MKNFISFKKTLLALALAAALLAAAAAACLPQAGAKEARKPKLVMVAGSSSLFTNLVGAYYQLQGQGYAFQLKLYKSDSLADAGKVEEIKNDLQNADIFLLQMIGGGSLQVIKSILDVTPAACKVLSTGSDIGDGRIDGSEDNALQMYINNSSLENMRRMELYLLSKYSGLTAQEDLAPVTLDSRVVYHPDATADQTPKPNVEAIYNTVYGEVYQSGPGIAAGLAVNAVHRAVYAAVYDSSQASAWEPVIDTVHEAVYSAVYGPGQCAGPGVTADPLYNSVYSVIAQDTEPALVSVTVRHAVYQAVCGAQDAGPGVAADTVYKALYAGWRQEFRHGLDQYVETVSGAVYDALCEALPPGGQAPDTDSLYQSVYDAVCGAKDKGTGVLPGTFTLLRNYLAWYHLSGKLQDETPWIGIIATNYDINNDDKAMQEALLRSLEAGRYNVIPVYGDSDRKTAVEQFFMQYGKSKIDLLITASVGFNFIYGNSDAGIDLFKKLNVPVMAPVYSSAGLDDWQQNPAGIGGEVYWSVAYPELDGRIEPVFMGGGKVVAVDPGTGTQIVKNFPLDDRVARLAGRAIGWVNLRKKANADKKIALIYYNHYGGKDDIGASYLNLMESAAGVLQAMKDDGYRVEGDLSAGAVSKLIFERGRNIGSWAPGELEALVKAGAMTIPVDQYVYWYNTLPEKLREQVEKEWGPAPGNIMVHNGRIVIPGALLGNVFIGPQPMRGWCDGDEEDIIRRLHSGTLPPPHQYIAFYLWLQKGYKADAVIHLGTHGTLEWLPGRSVGLGGDDWPDALIGDTPDIYPYIVNNPGEGTQAKRRGYAVIIDHLIPPMVRPGLYGELDELQQLVVDYRDAMGRGDTSRAAGLQEQIIEKAKANSLDQDLGIDLQSDDFSRIVSLLHEYLEELAAELMPYGLHTFGQPPAGELLDLMVDSVVNYNYESRKNSRDQIRQNLLLTTNEMTNLLRALRGEHIEPGLGRDPVRFPDAMPTGRNLVSFDPRKVPDEAAWKTGREAADQLLTRYCDENGRYPETVGVVLWAIETMCTQGESVGLIFRLIGVEPVYDASGRVTKVKVTPLEDLLDKEGRQRPRIDVLVTISGLFRDTFACTVSLMDDAFRLIALLDESTGDNLVKKHYQDMLAKLQAEGMSQADAANLAAARIFGEAPGTYGAGVSDLVKATSAWDSTQDLIDTYLARMSYIYGRNNYGVQALETFRQMLGTVDAVTQVRDSMYGVLDNDDVYQYLGGLKLAAEAESGRSVDAYIVNTRNAADPSKVKVQSLSEFVGTELRTRVLNPKWIEGMLKEGFSGSRAISDHIANLFGVAATLGGVSDWAWQQVAQTFVFDKNISSRLNPYNLQAIIGWAMEAARRDMWQADPETLQKLSDAYIQSAAQYGVVCCHHTCANLVFNEWIANYTTVDSDTLNKFKQAFTEATEKELQIRAESPAGARGNRSSSRPTAVFPDKPEPPTDVNVQEPNKAGNRPGPAGPAPQQAAEAREEQAEAGQSRGPAGEAAMQVASRAGEGDQAGGAAVKGYEIEVKKEKASSGTGRKAVTAFAILAALGVVAVFIRGYLTARR